jgi:hypothetical protein
MQILCPHDSRTLSGNSLDLVVRPISSGLHVSQEAPHEENQHNRVDHLSDPLHGQLSPSSLPATLPATLRSPNHPARPCGTTPTPIILNSPDGNRNHRRRAVPPLDRSCRAARPHADSLPCIEGIPATGASTTESAVAARSRPLDETRRHDLSWSSSTYTVSTFLYGRPCRLSRHDSILPTHRLEGQRRVFGSRRPCDRAT